VGFQTHTQSTKVVVVKDQRARLNGLKPVGLVVSQLICTMRSSIGGCVFRALRRVRNVDAAECKCVSEALHKV
jgi:hypothetical protein